MEIVSVDKRKPSIIPQGDYETIEVLFSRGCSREEVIKRMKYDRNWYYRKLKSDPKLLNAESKGNAVFIGSINKDVAASIKKQLLGHKVKVKTEFYVHEEDEEGNVVKKLVNTKKEEKYFPPNASVTNAIGRQVIGNMKEEDTTYKDIEKSLMDLDQIELDNLVNIGLKVLGSGIKDEEE